MNFKSIAIGALLSTLAVAPALAGSDTSDNLVTVTQTSWGNYSFSETGFSDGASITGTFSGTDLNHNGQLSSFDGEITAFSMSFSGNSLVPAFTVDYSGLFGLVYDLNHGVLGNRTDLAVEGVEAYSTNGYSWEEGAGPRLQVCTGTNVCGVVSSSGTGGNGSPGGSGSPGGIPEPASWGLLILGCAGLGASLRSARRRSLRLPSVRRDVAFG